MSAVLAILEAKTPASQWCFYWASLRRCEKKGERVIRISVEVGRGGRHFRATVEARSIEQAVDIASERYPGREVRVLFPIDPEEFFDGGASCLYGKIGPIADVGGSNEMGQVGAIRTEAVG